MVKEIDFIEVNEDRFRSDNKEICFAYTMLVAIGICVIDVECPVHKSCKTDVN